MLGMCGAGVWGLILIWVSKKLAIVPRSSSSSYTPQPHCNETGLQAFGSIPYTVTATQRLQYPLIREYTLNHIGDPTIF